MSLECPYCEKEMRDPDDCYEEGVTYEHECPHCGKNFVFTISYHISYHPEQAPCLNGEEHDWKPIIGFPEEYFKNKFRCSYCDEERIISPVEPRREEGREI
jgi:hypothetical protein